MKLNPKEAPRGYVAKPAPGQFDCHGCAFYKPDVQAGRMTCGRPTLHCMFSERKDGCSVIFIKAPKARKKPATFAAWWKKQYPATRKHGWGYTNHDVEIYARRAFAAGRRSKT